MWTKIDYWPNPSLGNEKSGVQHSEYLASPGGEEGWFHTCWYFFIQSLFLFQLINEKRSGGTYWCRLCEVGTHFVTLVSSLANCGRIRGFGVNAADPRSRELIATFSPILVIFIDAKEFEMHRHCNYCFHQLSKNKVW